MLGLFKGKGARKGHDGSFGRRIGGDFSLPESTLRSYRTHIDDAAPSHSTHVWQRRPAHVQHSEKIRSENALPVRDGRFRKHAPAKITDVIDHNIEASVAVDNGLDE